MQTKAGSSCLAQTPQLSAHIPLTFSPKIQVWSEKDNSTLFPEKNKNKIKNKKLKEFLTQFQRK